MIGRHQYRSMCAGGGAFALNFEIQSTHTYLPWAGELALRVRLPVNLRAVFSLSAGGLFGLARNGPDERALEEALREGCGVSICLLWQSGTGGVTPSEFLPLQVKA